MGYLSEAACNRPLQKPNLSNRYANQFQRGRGLYPTRDRSRMEQLARAEPNENQIDCQHFTYHQPAFARTVGRNKDIMTQVKTRPYAITAAYVATRVDIALFSCIEAVMGTELVCIEVMDMGESKFSAEHSAH